MRIIRLVLTAAILIFAAIGLLFTGVFVAMQFGWLHVRGSIEARNSSILAINSPDNYMATLASTTTPEVANDLSCEEGHVTCQWVNTREWEVVVGGLTKDAALIERVSKETTVPSRLIATVVVPEQIRFFTANREVFKRYFEPLKILGSLSKFSLGVSGIKQETAEAIERHANNLQSPFYPGDGFADLLAYKTDVNRSEALYNRLTDEKDHYYSYLYTGVFIKEILSQWERAGYDISERPEIVATIFNLGFGSSKPNANPQIGGTPITIGGLDYTFGELAGLFYVSDQLPVLRK